MLASRQIFFALLAVAALLQACQMAAVTKEQIALFSPPVVLSMENPLKRAERIAALVPNSRSVVGHGDGMLPLYASGTVLVLQTLAWDHLEAGMTVVYGADLENPFNLVCHVLDEKTPERAWTVRGMDSPTSGSILVTPENYIGTVVAAMRRSEGVPPIVLPLGLAQTQDAYCLLRCHVGGELHPKSLPPMPREHSSAAATDALKARVLATLLARSSPAP